MLVVFREADERNGKHSCNSSFLFYFAIFLSWHLKSSSPSLFSSSSPLYCSLIFITIIHVIALWINLHHHSLCRNYSAKTKQAAARAISVYSPQPCKNIKEIISQSCDSLCFFSPLTSHHCHPLHFYVGPIRFMAAFTARGRGSLSCTTSLFSAPKLSQPWRYFQTWKL